MSGTESGLDFEQDSSDRLDRLASFGDGADERDAEPDSSLLSQHRLRKKTLNVRKEHDHQLASMTHAQFSQMLEQSTSQVQLEDQLDERVRVTRVDSGQQRGLGSRPGSSVGRPPIPSRINQDSSGSHGEDIANAARSADTADPDSQEQFYYTTTASDYDLELSLLFEELRRALIAEHEQTSREAEPESHTPSHPGTQPQQQQQQQQRRKPFETELVRQELRSWVSKLRALRAESESAVQLKSVRQHVLAREKELVALEASLHSAEALLETKRADTKQAEDASNSDLRGVHNEFDAEIDRLDTELKEAQDQLRDILPREQAAAEKARAAEKEVESVSQSQKQLETTVGVLRSELLHEHHERRRLRADVERFKHERASREQEMRAKEAEMEAMKERTPKSDVSNSSGAKNAANAGPSPTARIDRGFERRTAVLRLASDLEAHQEPLLKEVEARALSADAAADKGGKLLLTKLSQPLGKLRRAVSTQTSREGSHREHRESGGKTLKQTAALGRALEIGAALDLVETRLSANEVLRARLDQYDSLVGELTDQLVATYNKLHESQHAVYETESQVQRAKAEGARESSMTTAHQGLHEVDQSVAALSAGPARLVEQAEPLSMPNSGNAWQDKLSGLFAGASEQVDTAPSNSVDVLPNKETPNEVADDGNA